MPTDTRQPPLTAEQRRQVEQRVRHDLGRASVILDVALPELPVRFDLAGTCAGMYCCRGRRQWLRFNPWLFAKDFELHLRDTVTHEVAHAGIHNAFPNRRFKPHGPEWRGLMVAMGANPSATFRADLTGVPVRRQQRHRYHCGCREHAVTTTRHNRIQRRQAEYRCRYCDGLLQVITA